MRLRIVACLAALLLLPSLAHAKSYSADRFDVRIRVLAGGSIEVTETIVFRFTGGTFSRVFRQIPARRTDGIDIEQASMDGVAFGRGKDPGELEISRSSGIRATWHFAPVSDSTHTFELTYTVAGVVHQADASDLLGWRALPTEHDYPIAVAAIDIELPAEPIGPPRIVSHRVESQSVYTDRAHVRIDAYGIRSNGWIEGWVRAPRGAIIASPPEWQQRSIYAASFARVWIALALVVLAAGAILLVMIRLSYDAPAIDRHVEPTGPALPDSLPPALAGALAANGRTTIEQAMATVFALAARGELAIREERKMLQREFLLTRTPSGGVVSEIERRTIEIMFGGRHGQETIVSLGTARNRLARHARELGSAVADDLASAGLMDEHRKAVRGRFRRAGALALVASALAAIAAGVLALRFGPWPFLVVSAFVLVGLAGLIAYGGHTPLSDEGIRRARAWHGLQRYLREVSRDRATPPATSAADLLPFAIGLGLASAWSRYLKRHHDAVPAWFQAMANEDASQAFGAFVAYSGASAGSGGSGAAGAAGGGASGAS